MQSGWSTSNPVGGRPASGLSRRRTTQQGPPPSYYRNQSYAGSPNRAQGRGGAHGRTYDPSGGMGVGGRPSSRTDDVPHFNWDEKYRQHHGYQQRNRRAA